MSAPPNVSSYVPVPLEAVFKALGHRVRLQIVRELIEGERCVCDLVELSGLAWSSVSRHLSVLRQTGVVEEDKRGAQVFYHLRMKNVANFIRYMEDPEFRSRADAFVASLH
ncbi:MAG: winged helix-turn-helix transcriptional regulator [Planctomycetes bacterium]|nr:winged helix-turn-helix transcriptional regulator [Planctomycetota bacterium]